MKKFCMKYWWVYWGRYMGWARALDRQKLETDTAKLQFRSILTHRDATRHFDIYQLRQVTWPWWNNQLCQMLVWSVQLFLFHWSQLSPLIPTLNNCMLPATQWRAQSHCTPTGLHTSDVSRNDQTSLFVKFGLNQLSTLTILVSQATLET